jgi:hypothetical protein
MRFYVVMHEEQHYVIEAESEQALRAKIETEGPPSGWRTVDLMENRDTIVSIEPE